MLSRTDTNQNRPISLNRLNPEVKQALKQALDGKEISTKQAISLFAAEGNEYQALLNVADKVRQNLCGDTGSFVITRNINFTNVCYMGCKFCNFAKPVKHEEAEFLSLDEIANRAQQAWDRGATEVCIQGGLHPQMSADFYRNILLTIKSRLPKMHIHAFSPFEIWYGSRKAKMEPKEFLRDLKLCGLDSMPGTAAEILDVEIREQLTKNKLSTEDWVTIIKAAHEVGIRTTSTIMYGHIDQPYHWANHLETLRNIQKETGGFTEFVPLGFVHYKTKLYNDNPTLVRPGPTRGEHFKMHAVARLMLQGQINNIQASWVKMGSDVASQMLRSGANDLGGTLMNESISRAAGGEHGQEIEPQDMVNFIHDAGLNAVQRSTLYSELKAYPLQSEDAKHLVLPSQEIARFGATA
ncbi:5-amino-6-(D-ribitylamino)uracil--L-tyrosine 4-hydroxyphenyl transferase CofH [Vibrio sp. TH_r3]|uniref:5-amino-6-(D-ribitylamino)uracil--L-tyrosine 4-hydroxyphenyl transferase CofH n=1 Tax=Vibrio sp. TH_r3 TaxID=3082084 RepID=UPI002954C2FF|nr:5-amino-6-(D-ribitylamino)uracil--L-tyrosine 4-hydroxyphenyl transferase CofH [Vibrio sp. TH_r3]MDV7104919.1 5-amino-6-(D-ribitylamino)uracil--L-tyrosine 4-hydroxyphenyl transferase CofH [Vibrio sp. TH_r3]